jgi:hypothetical protein
MKSKAEVSRLQDHCKFYDGPRLAPEFSQLLSGGLSTKNGINSYVVAMGDHAWCDQARRCLVEWRVQSCPWCDGKVAGAYLDDGAEVCFEIVADENNLPAAELTQPHHCAEMVKAEQLTAESAE